MASTDGRPSALLPLDATPVEWNEMSLPARYGHLHTLPKVYVEVVVLEGRLRLTTWSGRTERSEVLTAGKRALLPPNTEHSLKADGSMRCTFQRLIEEDPLFIVRCPVCHREIETGTNHDACRESWPGRGQERFYARPREGESQEEFGERFAAAVLGMIAEHPREHPELKRR